MNAPHAGPTPAPHELHGACPHDCPDTCALHITVQDRRVAEEGEPLLEIDALDADARGLTDGGVVRVFKVERA